MKFHWGKIPADPSNQRLSGPCVFRVLLEIVITTGLALACLQVQATPQDLEQQVEFDIPRQTADRSLIEFAAQAGVTLVFPFDEAAEVTTNRLKGRYTLTEGLTRLLEGTSLASSIDDGELSVVSTNKERGQGKMKTSFFGRLLSALAVGSATTGVAVAQDNGGTLEEVIVTAQKREQSVMEVPFSMQALTGDALSRANIRDLQQVMELVPGAIQTNENSLGRRQYSIRGVDQGFSDPTVSYYVDDAAYFPGEDFAPIARTFDISRVEVLRGPQSTLWGASSMGGTVRFITEKPNLEKFEAHVRAGYYDTKGGDDSYYTDAAVSVPLVEDKLALRVVGSFEDVGGWTEDALGNENVESGDITSYRASLLWAASDDLDVQFTAIHNEIEQEYGNIVYERDPVVNFYGQDDVNENEYDFFYLTFNYDLGWAALTNTTTYIDATPNTVLNLAVPIPPPFGPPDGILSVTGSGNTETINNEFRLVSQGDSDLQWIAGVFYADEDLESTTASNAQLLLPDTTLNTKSESISVFGEISYSLMDGRLIPLVGLRYFEDDRSAEEATGTFEINDQRFDSWNPRFNLAWFPNDTSNYYLNVVKGFRSGELNSPPVSELHATLGGLPSEVAVDSDELWSYEIGGKFTLLDGQLQLETAAYYMDWQDFRQNVTFFNFPLVYTFGDAEIYGVDLSVKYAPASIDGLNFTLVANLADGELTRVDPALEAATGIEEGSDLPGQPDSTFALSTNYSWSMGDNWQGIANLTYSYIGEQFAAGDGDPIPGDARNLLRGRIGGYYKDFGVFLFGNNLLDEDGFVRRSSVGTEVTGIVDRPRQIGIEITYDFE